MKRKSKKSKKDTAGQELPCKRSPQLKGPLFGSDEFVTAYCNARWANGGKGICGPTAVASAIGVKDGKGFKKLLDTWTRDIGFDGIALVRDVKNRLEHYGIGFRSMRAPTNSRKLALPKGVDEALVLI